MRYFQVSTLETSENFFKSINNSFQNKWLKEGSFIHFFKLERLYWVFWIFLPTALSKRFRVPLWGPKMKWFLVSYQYQIFLAQISAHTYCSSQRVWQSDQFPPLFFQSQKKVGETSPIAKPSEMSNMYVLKSGLKKFCIDSSQGTISFCDLRVERGNA